MDQTIALWSAIGIWLAGLATFLAVVVSLFLSQRAVSFQRKAEMRKNAADLYALFTSPEMERVRHRAAELLRANNASSRPLSFQELHDDKNEESLVAVTLLLQFWERTSHFLDAEFVDASLTERFLKRYLQSHHQDFLRQFIKVCENRPDDATHLQWISVFRALATRWNIEQ
jgi:transcriptional accessory protein Tex/SPT6